MTATLLDWSDLTAAQSKKLVTSPAMTVDIAAELLNPDLTVARALSVRPTGDVHWLGSATVHRDAAFTMLDALSWGTALVRLKYLLTDTVSGLAASQAIGAYCLHTPDTVLGEKVLGDDGQWVTAWSVTGQDRLYLLDREVGASYMIAAGTGVLDAITTVYGDAGLTGFLIDSTAAAATVPVAMTWPLIPGFGISTDDNSSGPTTWLTILNDLHKLINYRGVWADERGYYRSTPYVDPAMQASGFVFDATDLLRSPVGMSRTRSQDQYGIPNVWIFTRDNLASGAPPVAGAGLYVVENTDDGPSSINQRGGLRWPTQIALSAADQATLVALGDARVASDKRSAATYTVPTAPYPCAGHFDVFTYLEEDFGSVAVAAQEWTLPLDGSDMTWQWASV